MWYTSGSGSRLVVNSRMSTCPPACIQAVSVEAGVGGMGLGVLVNVGVKYGVLVGTGDEVIK